MTLSEESKSTHSVPGVTKPVTIAPDAIIENAGMRTVAVGHGATAEEAYENAQLNGGKWCNKLIRGALTSLLHCASFKVTDVQYEGKVISAMVRAEPSDPEICR